MQLQEFIQKSFELYGLLLEYIDDEESQINNLDDYKKLKEELSNIQKRKDQEELNLLLHLIASISNNHYRNVQINKKIEQLIVFLIEEIKQTFSNNSIYDIFSESKQILLFLFQNQVLYIDNYILNSFSLDHDDYFYFFYPECHFFIDEVKQNEILNLFSNNDNDEVIEEIKEKRSIGENDSYISSLIRKDSIEDFIVYVNQTNLSLSNSLIKFSNFETNCFLIGKNVSLIEYAAFFGAIQIFQYLKLNQIELTPSLWLFAIHSKNAELINILEECSVSFPMNSCEICIKEAIKCHHNDLADYFDRNFLKEKNVFQTAFQYYNYLYFPDDLEIDCYFNDLYRYDYFKIINLLLKEKENEIKEKLKGIDNNTALFDAANKNQIEIVYYLLLQQDKIEDNQFKFCKNLKNIYIPPTIKSIGKFAFGYCSSLISISIPSSVVSIDDYAFYQCSSLTSITISSFVESIPKFCFYKCISLKKIKLPAFVETICENSFENCSSMIEFYIPMYSNLTIIKKNAFKKCSKIANISIPSSVTSIGEYAFSECKELKTINEIVSIQEIKEGTFYKCLALNNIKISLNVKKIGLFAFCDCESLKEILLSSNVTKIEGYCFSYCTSLKNMNLRGSIENIPCNAFNGCSSLKSVHISKNVKSIDNSAFENCENLSFIIIPSSVTVIGSRAFAGCKKLNNLRIPSFVTFIGEAAFDGCLSMKKISIPPFVNEIKNFTFKSCKKLEDVDFNSNVNVIGESAFDNCLSLKQLKIPSSVTKIGKKAFNCCESLKLAFIPSSLIVNHTGIKNNVRIIKV